MSLDQAVFSSIISAHIQQARKENPEWDRRRAMYRCQNWRGDGSTGEVDPDLRTESGALYAYADTMVASVVPPNPRVSCMARRGALKEAARYRSALVNDTLQRSHADLVLWRQATHATVYPRGIIKSVWNQKKGRPDFLNIDPRNFFYDMEASRFEDIRYCIEVTVMTKAEFLSRVPGTGKPSPSQIYDGNAAKKVKFSSYPAWLKDPKTGRAEISDAIRKVFEWCIIFEVYDYTVPGGRYFHFAEDVKEPLFSGDLPYVFVPNPFCTLSFNDNLEDPGGLSDAELIEGPVRRRDELLTLELRFAQATIPVTVVDESELDDPEEFKTQLANATSPGDVVTFKGKNGRRASEVLGQTPTAALSPSFSSIDTNLDNEIMFRLGMPQYTRGVAGTSNIATELALVDAALRTRQGRRSKLVNHVVEFMAKATVGLYEEFMDAESTLPVRLGKAEFMEIARQNLAARDPRAAEKILAEGGSIEEPLDIDYEVFAYSPVENSKSALLQKIEKFALQLFGNPIINQQKLMKFLLESLDVPDGDDLVQEAPPPAPPGAPGMGGAPPPMGPPGSTPPTGGIPDNMGMLNGGGELPPGVQPPPDVNTGARAGMAGGAGANGAVV